MTEIVKRIRERLKTLHKNNPRFFFNLYTPLIASAIFHIVDVLFGVVSNIDSWMWGLCFGVVLVCGTYFFEGEEE